MAVASLPPRVPVFPFSIFYPAHVGVDEYGNQVHIDLAEKNILVGGEPGGGKSVALNLLVAHGALSSDCKLNLIDGKQVELGMWRDCADVFVGPSVDDAISALHALPDPQGTSPEASPAGRNTVNNRLTPNRPRRVVENDASTPRSSAASCPPRRRWRR